MGNTGFQGFLDEVEAETAALMGQMDLDAYQAYFRRKTEALQCRCCGGLWCDDCGDHANACVCGPGEGAK